MRRIVMERNESLRTYLGRELESVPVGAVSPSSAACIFLGHGGTLNSEAAQTANQLVPLTTLHA
jgi:hypothetical protein